MFFRAFVIIIIQKSVLFNLLLYLELNFYMEMKGNLLIKCFGVLLLSCVVWSCSGPGYVTRNVKRMIEKSDTLNKYQVGFALFDPAQNKFLYSKDLHKYYTPASNTKLYTFYASINMLPENIPALKYIKRNDSLIFWGTGDPSFLQAKLKGTHGYDFLKSAKEQLFYSPTRYTGSFYGAGWQWDDYNDYYQPEINELPIMDNMISVKNSAAGIIVTPQIFKNKFFADSTVKRPYKIIREFDSNVFKFPVNASAPISATYAQQVPYKLSFNTTLEVLEDTLKRKVKLVNLPLPKNAQTLVGMPRDSILKEMMLPSDNFIAEHLILLCSDQLGVELNTAKTIDYILKNYLADLPDKPIWVDGSGLSRYNLFTPADNIHVLHKMLQTYPNSEELFKLLPAGGFSGTLRNAYPATKKPFVFGKTGTVSNTHNQSGYIKTKEGKILIYSFMNNNFVLPTADIRKQISKIVTFIYEKY